MNFWKRVQFLFTGLLPESILPVRKKEIPNIPKFIKGSGDDETNTFQPTQLESVPFFEINKDEVKSNL